MYPTSLSDCKNEIELDEYIKLCVSCFNTSKQRKADSEAYYHSLDDEVGSKPFSERTFSDYEKLQLARKDVEEKERLINGLARDIVEALKVKGVFDAYC